MLTIFAVVITCVRNNFITATKTVITEMTKQYYNRLSVHSVPHDSSQGTPQLYSYEYNNRET